MQNLKHVGATVIELRFFNQIKKKKKEKNIAIVKITFMNIAHILHQITSNF